MAGISNSQGFVTACKDNGWREACAISCIETCCTRAGSRNVCHTDGSSARCTIGRPIVNYNRHRTRSFIWRARCIVVCNGLQEGCNFSGRCGCPCDSNRVLKCNIRCARHTCKCILRRGTHIQAFRCPILIVGQCNCYGF